MKRLAIAALCLVLLGCGKKDADPLPTHTTPDGTWTYSVPGNHMKVEFELKTTGTVLEILNTKITLDQQSGMAAGTITGVNLPVVDQIRINANDPVLITNYSITFVICTFSEDYNSIFVADAEYNYPNVGTLQNISITRKQ
jgi:hypothetical protein